MKAGKNRQALCVLVLALTVIVLYGSNGAAQQQFELPQQSPQGPPPVYTRSAPAATPIPRLPSGSEVRTLPQVSPQSPAAPSTYQPPVYQSQPQVASPPAQVYQSQPVLPAVFRGCWEGRVDYLDSLERLPGGARLGFWTPKTYRLCYRRTGNGPFILTLTEAGIEHNDRIINAEGQMTLLSSDGRSYASMRSDLDFDEYRTQSSFFGSSTFAVHEVADLDCRIEPDGMHVTGVVTGWRNQTPWFRARWHTIFVHQGEPPQQVEVPPGGVPE
jgi:hypothetical protein